MITVILAAIPTERFPGALCTHQFQFIIEEREGVGGAYLTIRAQYKTFCGMKLSTEHAPE